MARHYAGILGIIAFVAMLARGLFVGGGAEFIMLQAWLCLLIFSAIGFVIGGIGKWMVDESVRSRIAEEIYASKDQEGSQPSEK